MKQTRQMVLAAFFLALGQILPFFVGQVPQIGSMLLPMHIPVLLCGLICGWKYGAIVGALCPILRSALFGMPMMFPNAVAMAFELMTYGGVVGYLWATSKYQCIRALYKCLIPAMIIGRLVWGLVSAILFSMAGQVFTPQIFVAGALLNAIPGILLQLILIPTVMLALDKTGLVHFEQKTI